jgi:diguanylate cyclase (GGDEF)-like protein
MMEDILYSEMLFLQAALDRKLELFHPSTVDPLNSFKIRPEFFLGMVETLLEEMYVSFDHYPHQELVWRLRREHDAERPDEIPKQDWIKPRTGIRNVLQAKTMYGLRITYRGARRIEELRDLLKRDRILDDFGVLLSIRYLHLDLQDALNRPPDISVSVIRADMDNFGPINKKFGHEAGDEVMKNYLLAVRDAVGLLGTSYRGVGDETASIIVGQGHQRACEIANEICARVRALKIEHKGQILPGVTASVGVATSPPSPRSRDVHTMAEAFQRKAKDMGKDRVVEA